MTRTSHPRLVDFHCHLDLYLDHEELIDESKCEGVVTLTVTTTPKGCPRNQDPASRSAHVERSLRPIGARGVLASA